MQVRNIMDDTAIAVLEDATFTDLLSAMERFAVGAVTVVDADRRPLGVVSMNDLLLKVSGAARQDGTIFEGARRRHGRAKAAARTAAELMTAPAITVTPGTPVRNAARLMREKRVRQLSVIDPVTGRIIGMVRQSGFLAVFTRPARDVREEITAVAREVLGAEASVPAIEVHEGVVRLDGEVSGFRQEMSLLRAVRQVEGVIDVEARLAYPRRRGADEAAAGGLQVERGIYGDSRN